MTLSAIRLCENRSRWSSSSGGADCKAADDGGIGLIAHLRWRRDGWLCEYVVGSATAQIAIHRLSDLLVGQLLRY